MRVFLTGSTGFVMGAVARRLRARDDEVVALVRSRARGRELGALGCELVEGDIVDLGHPARDRLRTCDALVHGAAIYEIGVTAARRRAMEETNVTGTRRMLEAARDAGSGASSMSRRSPRSATRTARSSPKGMRRRLRPPPHMKTPSVERTRSLSNSRARDYHW